jgi:formate dehydrogenase major subunit
MAVQRRGTGRHADHAHRGIRARQGALHAHRLRAHPLLLTTGRILSQYNVGAQTRRTDNVAWHHEDRLEIHPTDAESRGINEDDWVGIGSRAGQTVLRARITERVAPGVVYTTFHFPESGANVITTDNSDWATNCPEYKVTAVEVSRVYHPSEWQKRYQEFSDEQQRLLDERRQARGAKAEVRR